MEATPTEPLLRDRPPRDSTAACLAVLPPASHIEASSAIIFSPSALVDGSAQIRKEKEQLSFSLSRNGVQWGGGRRGWVKEKQNNEKRTLRHFRIPLLSTVNVYRNSSV